jgi:hypothetical protein
VPEGGGKEGLVTRRGRVIEGLGGTEGIEEEEEEEERGRLVERVVGS